MFGLRCLKFDVVRRDTVWMVRSSVFSLFMNIHQCRSLHERSIRADSRLGYSCGDGRLVDADGVDNCAGLCFIYTIFDARLCLLIIHSRRMSGNTVSVLYVIDGTRYWDPTSQALGGKNFSSKDMVVSLPMRISGRPSMDWKFSIVMLAIVSWMQHSTPTLGVRVVVIQWWREHRRVDARISVYISRYCRVVRRCGRHSRGSGVNENEKSFGWFNFRNADGTLRVLRICHVLAYCDFRCCH